MSEKNWQWVNGVKVNNEVAEALRTSSLVVLRTGRNGWPVVGRPVARCRQCSAPACPHVPAPTVQGYLHDWVWRFFRGADNPRKPGEHIHHRWSNKLDARIKSLEKVTASQHARIHNKKRRKHGYRVRFDGFSLRYRPHRPARVKRVPELIGQVVPSLPPPPPRLPSFEERVHEAEGRLAVLLPDLRQEMASLDSGTPIPRDASTAQWRSAGTRMLGIKRPRLACTWSEAAFVHLYIKKGFDLAEVAAAVGFAPEYLAPLLRRASVSLALERWRKYRRLPSYSNGKG